MKIWVDADACPGVIKEILFRAAERTQTPLTLVANQALRTPPSRLISTVQVPGGFDVADNEMCAALIPEISSLPATFRWRLKSLIGKHSH